MKIITISREYGAGGHSIGTRVAKELGIEFYDKDIIRGVAKASGLDPELIAKEEEEISAMDSFFRAISPSSYVDKKDSLYNIHRAVILSIAKKGPCVILGRCADAILEEDNMDSLDVFIYANDINRAVRVGEMLNTTNANEIQKQMHRIDRSRHNYYTCYTGKRWGDSRNYDMCLNSGALGYDACVELICAAAKAAE